jgi:two-component system, LytTR family, response regulator
MKKITCIILDDEKQCVNILEKMLEKYCAEDIEIMGSFTDSIEALKQIQQLKPQFIFCDIEMPRLNGIDLANAIGNIPVVFTTAHSEYAIDAFKVDAIAYLIKPFGKDDLIAAIERCKKRIVPASLIEKAEDVAATNKSIKLSIHLSSGTIQFIESSEIVYIESQSNYSHFILKNKPKLVVSKTLKEFDDLLSNHGFFRTHQSYLVNMDCIDYYKGGTEDALILTNGDTVYLSRRRKQEFLERMSQK